MTPAEPRVRLLGVDFTSAPRRAKPIVVARGELLGSTLRLARIDVCTDFGAFESMLREPGPWLGAFDFPFGLPRAFVDALALGSDSAAVIAELRRRCANRMGFRALVDAWGNERPPGQRLIHRATDVASPYTRSTSPLQTRYVPVGFMYFEGLARLIDAGVTIPRMQAGDPTRMALEGYPGLLAAEVIGARSYKNRDDGHRLIARKDLIDALEQGRSRLGLRIKLTHAQREAIVADAMGDRLDAVMCLMQAGCASMRPGWGLPADLDPIEGWIIGT